MRRGYELPRPRKKSAAVTCAFCNRKGESRHVCDHGVPCGESCERCFEVELFASDSDEGIHARRRGLFEVELVIGTTVSARVFRRIMAAMREDWES